MTAVELVTTLRRQGFTLIPLPEGKLAVKPADRLTDDLRQHIRQCKEELVQLLRQPREENDQHAEEKSREGQPQPVVPWLCPHCGEKTVRLDPVDVTILPTQLWTCSGCGAYGATREGAA